MNALLRASMQLVDGFRDWRRWAWLGLYDVRLTNRRSFIGIWWPVLSLAIFVFGVGTLFSSLMDRSLFVFLPHVALGWFVWQLILSGVVLGAGVFHGGRAILQEAVLAPNTLILRILTRLSVQTAMNLVVLAAAFIFVSRPVSLGAFAAIPGIILIVLSLHGAMLFLGVICVRFRDLQHLVEAGMRLAFFVTPIIWIPAPDRSGRSLFVDYNPFYYMIESVRLPFMEGVLPSMSLTVVAGLALVSNIAGLIAFTLARRRIIYWL